MWQQVGDVQSWHRMGFLDAISRLVTKASASEGFVESVDQEEVLAFLLARSRSEQSFEMATGRNVSR